MTEKHADDSGKQKSRSDKDGLGRRSYLRASAGAATLLAAGTMASANTSPYEVVEVAAGDTYRASLGDGDTLENVLIDISASGAEYDISASGNDWTIRNVGIRGHWDGTTNKDPFRIRVTDPDSSGLVENVHLGITTESDQPYGSGPSGMFVWRDHAGHIDIRGCYLNDYQDNGIYGSAPGNPPSHPYPGSGGTIRIENCYAKECGTSNFRLGTSGSSIRNSVSVGGWRGIWAFINDTEVTDSDVVDARSADIALGDSNYPESDNAVISLDNSRWATETTHGGATTGNIHGSSAGTPRDRLPENCPATPEEAASGDTGGGSEPNLPQGDFTLDVTTNSSLAEYLIELEADEVVTGANADTHDHEYQDRAFQRDGRWYIHGYTAGGQESYQITGGEILRVGELQGSALLSSGGQQLDLGTFDSIAAVPTEETNNEADDGAQDGESGDGTEDESVDELSKTIVVDGSNHEDLSNYTFTVSGQVERSEELTHVEDSGNVWDDLPSDVSGQRAIGIVGRGQDGYRYSGEVTSLRITGNATVRLGEKDSTDN